VQSHTDLPLQVQKELATRSETVTPWWWGLRTLIKVCCCSCCLLQLFACLTIATGDTSQHSVQMAAVHVS
jgi:hypothetical protein